jgi:hypothetical protein
MKELSFSVNIKEINTILKALGNMPYNQVNELITKLHGQAQSQLTNDVLADTTKNEKN